MKFRGVIILFATTLALTGCATKKGDTKGDGSSSNNGSQAATSFSDGFKESGPIYFEFNLDTLTAPSKESLKVVATEMAKFDSSRVTIEGHADERGSTEYNLSLGNRRAQMAKQYLVNLGIPEDRIRIISYGEEKLAEDGATESAHQKNRRDEFRFHVEKDPVSKK